MSLMKCLMAMGGLRKRVAVRRKFRAEVAGRKRGRPLAKVGFCALSLIPHLSGVSSN